MQGARRGVSAALSAAAFVIAASAAPAQAAEQQAYAVGLMYATPAIVVSQGDTLRFNNEDPVAKHDIVSDTAGQFTSPLVAQGESTLVGGVDKLAPGTYAFHCELHSWMNGVIDVVAPGTLPAPPAIT